MASTATQLRTAWATLLLAAAACTPDVEPLVVRGLPAPGVPEATARFFSPRRTGVPGGGLVAGTVVFPDRGEDAVWVVPPWRDARLLLLSGEPLPELGGARFDRSGSFWVVADERGQVAVAGLLEVGVAGVTEDDDSVLLRHRPGRGFSLVAREGDAAPGLPPGYRFLGFSPVATAAGAILAQSAVAFGDDDFVRGLWLFEAGDDARPVIQVGQQIPGSPPGTVVSFSGCCLGALNAKGQVAFRVTAEPGVSSPQAILRWSAAAGLERVAGHGDPAPGTETSFDFFPFSNPPLLTERGEIVFAAVLAPTATEPQRHSLWRSDPDGTLVPLVIAGDPIANLPGFKVESCDNFRFDDGIATCFGALFDPSGDFSQGLYQTTPHGEIELIVRRGDPLPPGGTPLASLLQFERLSDGRVVFETAGSSSSVFVVTDPVLGLRDFPPGGREFEVAPGDIRTVGFALPFYVPSDRALYAQFGSVGVARIKIPASSEGPICEGLDPRDPLAKLCLDYCGVRRCESRFARRLSCDPLRDAILREAAADPDHFPICR